MEYILIGQIINTRGIRGELKIRSYTDFNEERFGVGNHIYIKYNKKYIKAEISGYTKIKKSHFIKLKNMEDINLVENYKGCELFSDMESEIILKENEYFANDLRGLEVYQSNVLKGKVVDVKTLPHGDYLDILDLEDKHHLVPFRDEFVLQLDMDNNRMDIIEMDDLL